LRELADEMRAGKVDVLLMAGVNPVYTAPADVNFNEALLRVGRRIALSYYNDETAQLCHWVVPQAHDLEAWGDGRAFDGTVSVLQPLIAPLFEGKSLSEILSVMIDEAPRTSHDIVRAHWEREILKTNADKPWNRVVHDGFLKGSASAPVTVALRGEAATVALPPAAGENELEFVFRPDPTIWDGRFANNGWMQELPKPVTRLTWDNAAILSPATAKRLNVEDHDVVTLSVGDRRVKAPVLVLPGQADGSVTLHLGYGRGNIGRIAPNAGFNAGALRTADMFWTGVGTLERGHGTWKLATVRAHHSMEGRNHVRGGTLAQFHEEPDFAQHAVHVAPADQTLYPQPAKSESYAWGMTVDLNTCIGCNACVVACVSEINIPVVGIEHVLRGREMQWIRVDQYFAGDPDAPTEIINSPVPCMHCEYAPCEPVCPVGATTHSPEGLNEMTYNRCVGTRYCSNNCPYKVRRFNFYRYTDNKTEILKFRNNPDVTIRARGVMEKCTYCVQRINHARITAKEERRLIRDGEIVTACAQTCPTQAIVFGNILDPDSQVSKKKADPRNYAMLGELDTRPRTTYLAKIRNPNPELESEAVAHG
jgi:molybdopterin-containing oxidoreductase family iron-sulfur binding subunit